LAIEESWRRVVGAEFDKDYMGELREFLRGELRSRQIYPPKDRWFRAFELTPFESVRVVILGQDPYHGANQAHGLCFSVQSGVKLPPSLVNIFLEIAREFGVEKSAAERATSGDLSAWAQSGVLLLNSVLTVAANEAASHGKRGWERFTDVCISALNERRENLVFMLWGNYAKSKIPLIDPARHLVLSAAHPSPLSAHSGFFGCDHFKIANQYLQDRGITPIDWLSVFN
jgi:uracil-DNA glycosylase